ncbi:MAG: hypothetical protein ABH983_05800 [Candidatus Micrarchaeota archaeon]
MRLLYSLLIFVFCSSILLGCVTSSETTMDGDVVVETSGDDTQNAEDDTQEIDEDSTPVEDVPVEEETPGEEDSGTGETAPVSGEVKWGAECEDDYDCAWSKNEECEYGFCVTQECVFSSSCPEGNHCFNGNCYSETELYEEFPECTINLMHCEIDCPTCEAGQRDCIMTGHSDGNESAEYRICVECTMDSGCSEGNICVDSYCVPGPDQ